MKMTPDGSFLPGVIFYGKIYSIEHFSSKPDVQLMENWYFPFGSFSRMFSSSNSVSVTL